MGSGTEGRIENRVHVFLVDTAGVKYSPRHSDLSAAEHERASRLKTADRADEWRLNRWLVRSILARVLRCAAAAVPITTTSLGKPYIPGTEFKFSVSHTAGLLAVAIAWGIEVGVDVECVTAGVYDVREYQAWTIREACAKVDGSPVAVFGDEVSHEWPSITLDLADPYVGGLAAAGKIDAVSVEWWSGASSEVATCC